VHLSQPTRCYIRRSCALDFASGLACPRVLGRIGKSICGQQPIWAMDGGMGTIGLTEYRITRLFMCAGFGCLRHPRAERAAPGNEPGQQLPEHV
jgi:hypothetical protein